MNEQQQAIWGKGTILLAYSDPGKYEYDNYRHGETEETQPATHILRPDEEELTLCGKEVTSEWLAFEVSALKFNVENWHPDNFEGFEPSNRACKSCTKSMKSWFEPSKDRKVARLAGRPVS